jgi:steroid delta-isomerase-like uncharacterized protein
MSATDLRQLADAAVDAFHSGDLDRYFTCYDPDLRFHGMSPEPMDLEATRAFYAMLVAAFPDASVTVHDTVAEGDRIVLRYSLYGTHRGEFMGIPATGRSIDVPLQTILRFRDGRIVERWLIADMMTMMAQLGASPQAA